MDNSENISWPSAPDTNIGVENVLAVKMYTFDETINTHKPEYDIVVNVCVLNYVNIL